MQGALIVAVLAFAAYMNFRGYRRARRTLEQWVAANGWQLVSVRLRWTPFLPFLFRSNVQRLFNIEVRDGRGVHLAGVAKVGGWLSGSLSDQVDVVWR
jgi:hypothetical protein